MTFFVNVPSIAFYAGKQLPRTAEDGIARGALWYVVSRSAALIASTVCAVVAAFLGQGTQWLWGIAVATALVQLVDVPVAAWTGDKSRRRKMTLLTLVAFAVQVAAIVAALVIPCR
ncbi:hypothetical protein [Agromyces bracchium]|uniref:Uncharacterized protein n=1 Tax=Agromyces bracchium TaxID=88376 RepID=A0A6I3MAN2_9MICO|nr:hypothetical protein [Agromyces bracchium]MTH69828.1 hypothetical protein [Agromyces bracchium]